MQPAALAPFGLNALTGWLAVILGCACLAITFAALARKLPQADGPFGYVRATLGEPIAFPAMWCYWISCWVTNAVLSIGVVGYFVTVFPAAKVIPPAALDRRVHVDLRRGQPARRQERRTRAGDHVAAEAGSAGPRHDRGRGVDPLEPAALHLEPADDATGRAAALDGGCEHRALCHARIRIRDRRRKPRHGSRSARFPRATLFGTLFVGIIYVADRRDRHAGRATGDARYLRRALRHDHRQPDRRRQRPLALAVRRHQRTRLPERLDAARQRADAHARDRTGCCRRCSATATASARPGRHCS